MQLTLRECIDFVEGVHSGVHLWPPVSLFHVGIFGDHVTRFLVCAHVVVAHVVVARNALCEFPPNILIITNS